MSYVNFCDLCNTEIRSSAGRIEAREFMTGLNPFRYLFNPLRNEGFGDCCKECFDTAFKALQKIKRQRSK